MRSSAATVDFGLLGLVDIVYMYTARQLPAAQPSARYAGIFGSSRVILFSFKGRD